jgi:DNA-binding transcriptional LysR family regulator
MNNSVRSAFLFAWGYLVLPMEWSDLRVFLAIAREGTLGAAARKLGQTQPTMGRRLRALEQTVHHSLFQRTSDGFVLTEEGHTVFRHAERIEEEALALERQLAGTENQLDGLLRISSTDWFGNYILSPVLAEFGQRYPKVAVELLTDARLYSLSHREADIAFRVRPFDEADVICRRLMHVRYALYGRKRCQLPRAGDGGGTRIIAMNTQYDDMPHAIWLRNVLPNAEVSYRSNNREVQAQLCARGGGLAILPRPLADATRNLAAVDIGEIPPGLDIFVGYHRDLRRLSRLRALLDLVIERLAN